MLLLRVSYYLSTRSALRTDHAGREGNRLDDPETVVQTLQPLGGTRQSIGKVLTPTVRMSLFFIGTITRADRHIEIIIRTN